MMEKKHQNRLFEYKKKSYKSREFFYFGTKIKRILCEYDVNENKTELICVFFFL